jgi:hypothetical protein
MVRREFVGGLHLDKPDSKTYIFNSTDWKTNMLRSKYGEEIMGINPDYWYKRQIDVYRLTFVHMIKQKAGIA